MAKVVSLNRAGKVKKQTPKVEKTRGAKVLCGRARKRQKYERRLLMDIFEKRKTKYNTQVKY